MDAGERVPSHIVATYRQIAEHFGLKGPDQGRTKAKRANWPTELQNHPADPVRVRVPAAVWEGALDGRERGLSGVLPHFRYCWRIPIKQLLPSMLGISSVLSLPSRRHRAIRSS